MMKRVLNGDILGIVVSGLCLAHCILLPLFLFLSPALSGIIENEALETTLLISSVAICVLFISRGFSIHKNYNTLTIMIFGVLFVLLGKFIFHQEIVIWIGSGLFIWAHISNFRARKSHN